MPSMPPSRQSCSIKPGTAPQSSGPQGVAKRLRQDPSVVQPCIPHTGLGSLLYVSAPCKPRGLELSLCPCFHRGGAGGK